MKQYDTLVIVDDNTAILTALKICLGPMFKTVVCLPKPESIMAVIAQEKVSLVMLDMNFSLGVNNGQEGLTWLSSIVERHPMVPVVLITAYADVSLAVKGMKMGAADFVTKPWDNETLMHTIRDVMERDTAVASLEEVEAEHVRKVVDSCHGNISEAAKLLGITRQTLYSKMKR